MLRLRNIQIYVKLHAARYGTAPTWEYSYFGYAGAWAIAKTIRLAGANATRAWLTEA